MVIVYLNFTVSSDKRFDVMDTIRPMIEPTLAIPGCRNCALFFDVTNDNRFVFIQEWERIEDVKAHVRSEDFDKLLTCMDLSSEAPDLAFYEISNTSSLDLVRQFRDL